MKVIKKILRIIAIILPCFCFTLISSDTYALKYTLDSIPYWTPHAISSNSDVTLSYPIEVDWYSRDGFVTERFSNITAPWAFNSYKSGEKCIYGVPGGSNRPDYYNWDWQDYSELNLNIGGWPMYLNSDSNYPASQCMLLTGDSFKGFGNNNVPEFQTSSIPLVGNPFTYNFRSFLPYNYDYDSYGILFDDSVSEETVTYNYIEDIDLFSHSVDKFHELDLPLNFNAAKIGEIKAGRSIRFSGRFTFFGQNNTVINSNTLASLRTVYLTTYNGYIRDNENLGLNDVWNQCSFRQAIGTATSAPLVYFDCEFIPQQDVVSNYIGFSFQIRSSSSSPAFDAGCSSSQEHACWSLDHLYVITDNDNTPADTDISYSPSGFSKNDAPGFPGFYESGEDYLSRITNLFNFSFINPFTPLFGLFTDSSRCVQIPTIAGMLGAESSTYCPWFDSTVRNILTPVLGISANMLLFGFLVKWLGARSGNFVEDTTNKGGK